MTIPPLLIGLAAGALALAILTGAGARRRGVGVLPTVLCGVLFPVTWTVWYIRDEQPWRHRAYRTAKVPVS